MIDKIFRRLCRSLAKSVFPNALRIILLRLAGVKIGKKVTIGEGFTLACDVGYEGNLIIEDRVAIGPNVTVVITSHPNNSKLMRITKFVKYGKVRIKHDSWIGANVVILPDVTIGEYSIVGAGSVVTKDIAPYSIAVGNPARVIRTLSCEEMEILG